MPVCDFHVTRICLSPDLRYPYRFRPKHLDCKVYPYTTKFYTTKFSPILGHTCIKLCGPLRIIQGVIQIKSVPVALQFPLKHVTVQ